MTDVKALICILGGVFAVMCIVFYGFLFLIHPEGVPAFIPAAHLKS